MRKVRRHTDSMENIGNCEKTRALSIFSFQNYGSLNIFRFQNYSRLYDKSLLFCDSYQTDAMLVN